MNISVFCDGRDVYVNREPIKNYASLNVVLGVKYALLLVICATFVLLQDNYDLFHRIEYLLPYLISA
ncbi:hypothetical protein CDQ83_00185 [Clostridium thermosuccinogenes]|jgi:hypothetical protein|nr:hypothetical protein CDQ83_00185 [Pseudoclostridium thermosuccinogenes]